MKSFHSSPPDSRTGFRLSKELLSSRDSICEKDGFIEVSVVPKKYQSIHQIPR